MEDHTVKEWGLSVNLSSPWQQWEISHVEDGEQGAKLGIKVGWKLKAVDDKLINEKNYLDIKKQLGSGAKSTIAFLQPVTVHYFFTFCNHQV